MGIQMLNWFELWTETGWVKVRDASSIQVSDVFRIRSSVHFGAWMVACTIDHQPDQWVITSRLLNVAATIACDHCHEKLDATEHHHQCPLCGLPMNGGHIFQASPDLLIRQHRNSNLQLNGVH